MTTPFTSLPAQPEMAPLGPETIWIMTGERSVVTTLLLASNIVSTGCWLKARLVNAVVDGGVVKTNCVAAPAPDWVVAPANG